MFEKFVETLNHTGKAVSEKTKQGLLRQTSRSPLRRESLTISSLKSASFTTRTTAKIPAAIR